jgi:hypothetical protein
LDFIFFTLTATSIPSSLPTLIPSSLPTLIPTSLPTLISTSAQSSITTYRNITTFAANGIAGFYGGTSKYSFDFNLSLDTIGNVYFPDCKYSFMTIVGNIYFNDGYNYRIRKITV